MTRENEYTDHEIRQTRARLEAERGYPMTEKEQLQNFRRILPRDNEASGEQTSGTGQSGRHAKEKSGGIIARFTRRGRKG